MVGPARLNEFFLQHAVFTVEELDHCGALHDKTAIAHLGWASSWEFNRMVEKGASAVHCPTSNQKLGTGGFFPYKDLKEKGMTIGLGTDSAASNNSLDMFREMRSMALIQKMQYWDPTAGTARDALTCAVKGGNDILGLNGGTLEKGDSIQNPAVDAADRSLQQFCGGIQKRGP